MNSGHSSPVESVGENWRGGNMGGVDDVNSAALPFPFLLDSERGGSSSGTLVLNMICSLPKGELGVWMEKTSADEDAKEDGESSGALLSDCGEDPDAKPDSNERANRSCCLGFVALRMSIGCETCFPLISMSSTSLR